ncbi:MAG: hypothetical protein ACK5YE_08145, partial [Planctomyces sp.]
MGVAGRRIQRGGIPADPQSSKPCTTTPTCLSRSLASPPLCCAAQPMTTIEFDQNSARNTR